MPTPESILRIFIENRPVAAWLHRVSRAARLSLCPHMRAVAPDARGLAADSGTPRGTHDPSRRLSASRTGIGEFRGHRTGGALVPWIRRRPPIGQGARKAHRKLIWKDLCQEQEKQPSSAPMIIDQPTPIRGQSAAMAHSSHRGDNGRHTFWPHVTRYRLMSRHHR